MVPCLREMQQEPAWPSIMAGHQPFEWPAVGSVPSLSGWHQDVNYLATEKVLSSESAQVIHSFYSFMLVRCM